MYNNLTLRNRIFVISTALIVVAFALMWVFIRPKYREAIINERTTIVAQLQEYSLLRNDYRIRNWMNSATLLADEIQKTPQKTEEAARRVINYTPGLMKIQIMESGSNDDIQFTRTIYNDFNFPEHISTWYSSKLDHRLHVAWVPDSTQNIDFLILERSIQVPVPQPNDPASQLILTLRMYFDAQSMTNELTNIPLGGKYAANIVAENGTNIASNQVIEIPSEMIGDASYSEETIIRIGNNNWFVMSSRFETLPFWHVILVEDSFILKPVHNLVVFSLITSLSIIFLMIGFSYYVSTRINQPIQQLLHDVDNISNLDFDHPIRKVSLPEFGIMQETLENIRITLRRYQKINVEKIILEEWKNRYMMTYSEDLIGILDNSGKFSFANNHFVEFIESFGKNPKETTFKELLNSPKLEISKTTQTVHFPSPYSIKVDRAEMAHFINEDTTYFYDYQFISFEDEDQNPQGAMVILHDKTQDRLVDIQRTDMINIIVHELKNPITGVVGLSKLMLDNTSMTPDEMQELLKEIYLSGERMNDLVNRFLDVQRLEFGRIPVEFVDVDMFQIVNDVKSISNPMLSEKQLNIDIKATGTNFFVKGSKELLFDAMQNLVSNAIKYGDKNRTIEIQLVEKENTVEVSVTDFGYGISLEDQKKVFEKFYRIRTNLKSAKEKGTGLGLAYVKEIVNKHRGDILLESDKEIGSRFTLVLPRKESSKD